MGMALALLVKAGFVTGLRLLLEWLGVPDYVIVAVAVAGLAVWGYRALMRRRAARRDGKPAAGPARRGVVDG